MTWADEMASLNAELLETFPDSIWFNGVEIDCIAPPLDIFKTITPGAYDAKVTFTFQILKTARTTAGIIIGSIIAFDTEFAAVFEKSQDATQLQFQVKNFQPDRNDSMVRLICNLKQ